MKKLILLLCLVLASFLQADDNSVAHVNVTEAAKLIDEKKLTILDVRTADEFKLGHIDGAENYDFTESEFRTQLQPLDRTKPYLVHCASGARSAKSLKIFNELGFENIYHMDGGINAWKEAGLPLSK